MTTCWLLLVAMCLAALQTGCLTNERKAYQTLDTTATLVESSLKAFRVLNEGGHISPEDYDKVAAYYADYQTAMNAAIDLAQMDMNQFTPERVMALAVQLINLIERIEQQ